MKDATAYRQVLKATSIFGSLQVFNVLVSVIRSKMLALWIGPLGIGISGLLSATINVIGSISSLGVETSAVRHIAASYDNQSPDSVAVQASVVRRFALYSGVAAAILAALFSRYLSILTFGDGSQTLAFVWLSMTLLFKQLATAELVILQGLRKLKLLARAGFFGNAFGLIVAIPLYYYYRIDAIVWALIAGSVMTMVFAFFFSAKIKIKKAKTSNRIFADESLLMLRLGLVMTLSGVMTLLASWGIQVCIGNQSGMQFVGLYNAGFTVLNSYVGILFTAMATDYFPRLSAIAGDVPAERESVNGQIIIGLLLITPIVVLCIPFSNFVLATLFTRDFIDVSLMVSIGMIGMLFRTVSFSLGYLMLARADIRIHIWTAIGFNLSYFALGITGYLLYGLTGLGIAFALHYFIHFAVLSLIAHFRYKYVFGQDLLSTFGTCCVATILAVGLLFMEDDDPRMICGGVLFVATLLYSANGILKRTGFSSKFKA